MTVTRTRFDNGLTLLTEELRSAPVVAIQAWVNVGSADETDDIAGIAHVHEHMLFKGTAARGSGEIARTVEAAGGEINAWTSYDQTVYHVVLASSEAATGLDILADAIRRSAFDADELTREIEVIVEEIRRSEDTPARRIAKALFTSAYERHPYKRPVIGSEATVRALTRERILEFFARHYRPDNVTLVITGDFETAAMVELARRYFGDWSRRAAPALPPRPGETPAAGPRVTILEEAVKEGRLSVAWHVPSVRHQDVAAIDVLSVLLGHGDSSRLYIETRRNRELVNDVYAYAYTPRDPGLLIVGAGLPTHNTRAALASVLEQVYGLRDELVPDDELAKAKVIVMSESAYQRETVQGEARKLGFFEVVAGDYAFERQYMAQLERLTPEDLRDAARTYLTAAPVVVVQQPPGGAGITVAAVESTIDEVWRASTRHQRRAALGRGGVTKVELDNGAVLLVRPEDSPVVAVRAVALGGLLWESSDTNGVGNFLSSVWGLATERWATDELAKRVALLGGHLASFSGRNSIGLRAEFIREKAVDGLSLFAEALLSPVLHEADVERERAVIIERIKSREDNPAGYAFDLFVAALFPGHPYGWRVTGTEETVRGLTREALFAHQRRMTSPDKLVLSVVGGISVERAVDVLARELERAAASPPLAAPPVMGAALGEPRRVRVRLDKKQSHVVIGGRGVTVTDPDRYPLEVLTTVLSGQSGRLFMDLRDRQSLAYSVSSSNTEGLQQGHVLVHIGTSPDKLEQALAGLYGHLERLREEPVAEAELERAVRYLVGTHAIELQRAGARATTMALNERFGLGYAHHEEYAARIKAVSSSDLQRVARAYLAQGRLVEVIVGP